MKMDPTAYLGICYGSLAFFTSILHNIFLLYHIDTFISIYNIDSRSFWIGESIFLIWNSFNDPFFGWISDRKYLQSKTATSNSSIIHKRIKELSIYGPLLSVAFILIWFQWLPVLFQLIFCLCLYDGFLTIVDLHHSALLADLTISSDSRTRLSFYNSLFGGFGSLSVFLSYLFWNKSNLDSFRIFCAFISVISFLGFSFSCSRLKKYVDGNISTSKLEEKNEVLQNSSSFKSFIGQILKHKNFMLFAVLNLLQVFHCHFNSNFFPFFLDVLVGGRLSPGLASFLLGISFLAPHFNNLYFMSLCRKHGTYKVIWFLFFAKFFLSLIMAMIGLQNYIFLCIFIVSNRIFTEGTCKLLNLIISDLVDEDYVMNNRKQAVSALIFGTSSLMAKPGQTIAPLLGLYMLTLLTGKEVFNIDNGQKFKFGEQVGAIEREACFTLLIYIPLICGLAQILLWSQFTLKGKRLRWIKQIRESCASASIWSNV